MKSLTDQQRRVLSAVGDYVARNGYPPTMREIGDAVGLANVNAVRGHLSALEKKGYITKEPDKARSIRVVHTPSTLSRLKRRLHGLLKTDRGVVHRVVYGVGWATRPGAASLAGERAGRLAAALEREAAEHGWRLLDCRVQPDHVVVVVEVWPTHSPDQVVRRLQAAGRRVKGRHGADLRGSSLWAPGYAATTDLPLLDELVARLLDGNRPAAEA